MLSATLKDGLEKYEIGEKLRSLRLRKKLGLVEKALAARREKAAAKAAAKANVK